MQTVNRTNTEGGNAMTVLDYCSRVQDALNTKRPAEPMENDWFGDTGRATRAVTHALEGKTTKALRIAERLAEKWGLVV